MKNYFTFKNISFSVIILGMITPFFGYFVVIEMFFLLIPFGIILFFSLILFIINYVIFKRKVFHLKSSKIFVLLPIYLVTQLVIIFAVDKIQRFRSEQIISTLEKNKNNYPEKQSSTLGIAYHKIKKTNNYTLKYSRGFLVSEVYTSEEKKWTSYGWND